MNTKVAGLFLFLPWAAFASNLPEPVLPAGVGVNIHFTINHENDLDMIAAAGFKFVRMDFIWSRIERHKGEYNWSEYDELTASLAKRGIRLHYILCYSNPLYEEESVSKNPVTGREERARNSPQHPESVAAFARWAGAAAAHFRGRPVVWEIWNEPNISFWKPRPDAEQYITLALATCRAMREADAQATIVAPASSGFPWDFLEGFLKSGVLQYLDGVSVHPYRSGARPPETAAADFQRLRGLIERYAPDEAKKKIPILSGEWGYSSNTKGVSLETQAAFLVRQQLSNLLNGIPLSIWYDWKNDGPDPAENEHNFGVVTADLKPKPAYVALQTLTRELSGYRIVRRCGTGNTNDFVLVLANPQGQRKLAAWTTADAHAVRLDLKADNPTTATGGVGINAAKIENEKTTLSLGTVPQFVPLR